MRWVEGWQNQGKQGCGPPTGVSALLLVPSSGSITSWEGAQGGPKPAADYGWQHLTPLKWNEPQHPTSCFLGSLTPPHTPRGTRCPQPTLYLGTWGSVQSPAVPSRGSVGDSSTQAGSGRGLRWAQLGLAPEEHFVCQWAEQKGKAKAEPDCNMKKQDEIPQAAWGCFHWRNPNDSIYAFQAGDFHFPGSCGMRQDPSLSQFAAPWCQGAWLFAGSSP